MNKADIIALLETNDKAVARALVVLNGRQTADEQATEATRVLNGRGFRPCHARMGTNMAKFFERRGYLSDKQIAYWRRPMASGKSRIAIYAGQLLEEANAKAAKTCRDVEAGMHAIEAAGDRAQTLRDETAKMKARAVMERSPRYYDNEYSTELD
jgi:hypothetical protein